MDQPASSPTSADAVDDVGPARASGGQLGAGPVLLFDGVCNLCNAAVQWVIRHDRRERFGFASLQSDYAKQALASAGAENPLPDSVVLIDEGAVHTRSDAALMIARRLGFPWSLAGVFLLIPRGVRDGVYSWVARHRYRWFGRQNACMVPTPELRERFLDAREPVRPAIPAPSPDPRGQDSDSVGPGVPPGEVGPRRGVSARAGLPALCHRIILAYILLYILPLPLGLVPEVGGAVASATRRLVVFVADMLFDLTITMFPAGSGDTTYNYVELLVFAALAVVAGAAWTIGVGGRPVSARTRDVATTVVRYYLAFMLLRYGWAKVFPMQFGVLSTGQSLATFGESSPMGLLWKFMAASPAYQMFGGLAELAGGALLFWRRTTLLGALVCSGVLLNIVMLNFCYDVPVKLFSTHLLLFSLFLVAPHAMRLAGVLVLNLPAQPIEIHPFRVRRRWLRWTLAAGKALLIAALLLGPGVEASLSAIPSGPVRPGSDLDAIYRVESFVRDGVEGHANPDEVRWVWVAIDEQGFAAVRRADGELVWFTLSLKTPVGTMTLLEQGAAQASRFTYDRPEDGVLRLEGDLGGVPTVIVMRRSERASLLMSRGFRWINETPFNR